MSLLSLVTALAIASGPPLALPEVVVSATGDEQPTLEAPRAIGVVDAERRRELQARTLPETLDETTGVFMQRTNRGAGSPIIRGLVGPQNLIVVDGVRFNTSVFRTGPNQYLALLDPASALRVEAVRGPSSVLYGDGAMGGVIQVLTDDPLISDDFDVAGSANLRVSSAGFGDGASVGGGGVVTGGANGFGFLLGGSYDHFGGLRVGDGTVWPLSSYDAGYWRAKLAFERGRWRLSAAYFGTVMRDAGRTDSLGLGEVRQYDNNDHLTWVRAEVTGREVFRRLRATVSYHRMSERVDRFNCTTGDDGVVVDRAACAALEPAVIARTRVNDDVVDTVGTEVEVVLAPVAERLNLRAGVDLYHDLVASTAQSGRGNFSDGSTYLSLGTWLHADATLVRVPSSGVALKLLGGARFSHFRAHAADVPGLGDVAYAFDGFVGSAGVQVVKADTFNLYASVLQGFRAPNLQETTVLGDTGSKFEVPNDDLGPERSQTLEVGGKVALGPVRLSAAYFFTQLEDAIDEEATTWEGQSVIDGSPVVRRVNTARGKTHGVEGEASVRLWRFTVSAGVAWLTSTLTDGEGETTPARRVPPVFGTAAVRYDHPDRVAYAEVSTRWAGPQRDLHPSDRRDQRICETSRHSGVLQASCDGTDGWAVVTVRGGWRFHPNLRADLAIANLLDTRYRVHGSGYDGPGIDARATLTADF